MSSVLIAFVLCFAAVFAGPLNSSSPVTADTDACLLDFGIDPDIYNKENVTLTNEQVYCPIACVYRGFGIMRPDGTINTVRVEDYFTSDDAEGRRVFFAVYDACKDGKVGCSLVQCMFKELKNHIGKRPASDENDDVFTENEITKIS